MRWQPLHDRVHVERVKDKRKGIILTDISDFDRSVQLARKVRVLSVGPKVRDIKPGEIWMLPGVGAEVPDKELPDGTFFVREADFGVRLR